MKRAMAAVLVVVLFASGLLAGCGGVLTGSGNLKTEEYTFFTSVEISSAFQFDISQSSSYGVSITADDNVLEQVEVTKEGNSKGKGAGEEVGVTASQRAHYPIHGRGTVYSI